MQNTKANVSKSYEFVFVLIPTLGGELLVDFLTGIWRSEVSNAEDMPKATRQA